MCIFSVYLIMKMEIKITYNYKQKWVKVKLQNKWQNSHYGTSKYEISSTMEKRNSNLKSKTSTVLEHLNSAEVKYNSYTGCRLKATSAA